MEQKQAPTQPRENPNIINVSNKRNQNFYVFLGKQLLKEHDWIEFQALGNAVSTAVMSAENLVRNNYANFKEIKTQTITMEREKDGQQKKAKLFIRLEKHADFDANIANFEKIKAENEKAVGAKKAAETTA